jgi:16S rRNA (guanine527-N7)-methyltransferase
LTQLSDNLIRDQLLPYGFSPGPSQCGAIRAYIALLLRWNKKVTLTTVVEPIAILRFHFGESIFALPAVPLENGRLADFGSGAGFPGLALRVVLSDLSALLIEPNTKKAAFLREVARELKLTRVAVVRQRMEEFPDDLGQFDYITARALGDYPNLLSVSQSLLTRDGKVILWLGEKESEKLSSQPAWNWRDPILIPGSNRRFLLIGTPVR